MNQSSQTPWNPGSWKAYATRQQPAYDNPLSVAKVADELATKPPLVSIGEIERLQGALEDAAAGKRFVLQGGDCAECFADCTEASLTSKLKVLLQMSLVLTYATRKPTVRIGRIAGQYAKPRSQEFETADGVELPVYRGDLVNSREPVAELRKPEPSRMLDGYHHAAASLNFIRALIEGGFADLHHPEQWDLSFIEGSTHRKAYRQAMDAIVDSIRFMETIGAAHAIETVRRVDYYASHEALLLPYEEALTRLADNGLYYNFGAHFLWVGYRTAFPESAHIEYLRGIQNPIGIKIGPGSNEDDILTIMDLLDPKHRAGRLTLITRFGETAIEEHLPRIIDRVKQSGHPVVWSCDPMHGNTETTANGLKTRRLDAIFSELEQCFAIHERMDSTLGGVHFELTGDPVTECFGPFGDVQESDLMRCYETACDPRLNGAQALEMAFLLARLLR
ncbi:MAG TPA: 3-deoxy-7-phosphoheptulonate synthase class II [Candidatus Hydrogenedentes bacterium]|nr:3-deoxy-7-phosphoheptulonate synthase class II [Candidatus Hydrogenedentota bacterium]